MMTSYPASNGTGQKIYNSYPFASGVHNVPSSLEQDTPTSPGMEHELLRLASYDGWPHWAQKRASQLASHGFYYSGREDAVVCYSCGVTLSEWRATDNVADRHRAARPRCLFVNANGSQQAHNNVPQPSPSPTSDINNIPGAFIKGQRSFASLPPPSAYGHVSQNGVDIRQGTTMSLGSEPSTTTGAVNNDDVLSTQSHINMTTGDTQRRQLNTQNEPPPCVNMGTIREVDDLLDYVKSLSATAQRNNARVNVNDANVRMTETSKDVRTYASTSSSSDITASTRAAHNIGELDYNLGPVENPDVNLLKHEMYRLRTFRGKWSEDYFVSPHDLARAGFYYFGPPDRVQCAFCDGRLHSWTSTDVPIEEHKRCYPTCSFVLNPNGVGNVTVEESQPSVQMPRHMAAKHAKTPSASEQLGVVTGRAKHPTMSLESSRLETFDTWPASHVIPKDDLAAAGFFYNGYSDNVRCFFCDGGLRNWQKGDDPWREHARWFARCGFLKLQKGEDFIEKVLEETKSLPMGNCNTPPVQSFPKPANSQGLTSPMIRAVLNMGHPMALIQRVIEDNQRNKGPPFKEAGQLLEAVLDAQDKQTQEREASEYPSTSQQIGERGVGESSSEKQVPTGVPLVEKPKEKKKTSKKPDLEDTSEILNKSFDDEELRRESEDVRRLLSEYERLRDERLCKVCMDEEVSVCFLPCGHLVCCGKCATSLRHCPICRQLIKGSVRVYNT